MLFTLHWFGGKTETVEGVDIADACRRAGIGNGALRALDFYKDETEKKLREIVCRWCGQTFMSELGLFCPLCCRFQGSSRNALQASHDLRKLTGR